jgi:hypothetical protein
VTPETTRETRVLPYYSGIVMLLFRKCYSNGARLRRKKPRYVECVCRGQECASRTMVVFDFAVFAEETVEIFPEPA